MCHLIVVHRTVRSRSDGAAAHTFLRLMRRWRRVKKACKNKHDYRMVFIALMCGGEQCSFLYLSTVQFKCRWCWWSLYYTTSQLLLFGKDIIRILLCPCCGRIAGGGAFDVNLSCRVEFYGSFCVAEWHAAGSALGDKWWWWTDRQSTSMWSMWYGKAMSSIVQKEELIINKKKEINIAASVKKGFLLWCAN